MSSLCLLFYWDVESGPASFWVNHNGHYAAHILRGESACLDREALTYADKQHHIQHLDVTATGVAAGIRRTANGSPVECLPSVYWDEPRPARPAEFELFGEHARRLLNLPRLLDDLFTSAGEELMGHQPDLSSIVAKLRFITLCAREAPNLVGLVNEAHGGKAFDDCFFVPDKVPATLESVMDVPMNIPLASSPLDDEAEQATHTTETVMDKMDDLRKYKADMGSTKDAFEQGLVAFKEKLEKKLVFDMLKAVVEVGVSVGIAIYTGGAGAPLTVGAVNKLLQGTAETVKEASRLKVAIKALAKVLNTVYPKVNAALQNHSRFAGQEKRGTELVDSLKATAGTISDKLLAGRAGERINYLGLQASWREMDICTDSAFSAIKEEIKDDYIDGMDEYRLAMKKLAIRGDTLVTALKDSYEARTRCLVMVADVKAKEAAMEEIKGLQQRVMDGQAQESIAFMPIRHRLVMELTQRQRVVFNMLHQGMLALVYQANDVKLHKRLFSTLSPGLTAEQLADHWDSFKEATIEVKQSQGKDLTVSAADAGFPPGRRDLLSKDLETPFQIPPTLKALNYQHHMRIRRICAEFVGLKRLDGTADGLDKLEYTIWLGPLMMDRASPYKNAPSSKGTVVQYYMEPLPLVKSGKDNHLIDDKNDFAKRAVCCSGRVSFKRDIVEDGGWDLETIKDIKLNVKYETLIFPS
ncbi:hypothetical protein B0H63DRAFT_450717 [Podospora didyma]|uniref:Uncharacterized protein n=1 Tax=Podospora didyma TaxID=330526 RepID=A0AAE0NH40_9PEZI|nr:hypothetical protein B0H63DRAFT_450717 [Podospora didyma]